MPHDAVIGFLEKVADTPHLQKRVSAAIAERGEFASHELVELGASLGFHFTATDLRKTLSEGGVSLELSEQELSAVAGGAAGFARVAAPVTEGGSGPAATPSVTDPGTTSSESTSTAKPKPATTSES